MLQKFQSLYPADDFGRVSRSTQQGPIRDPQVAELLSQYGGMSFGRGLYRIIAMDQMYDWRVRLRCAFPWKTSVAECFAYDWLGRLFAVDSSRLVDGRPSVILLEPGTAEVLEIPCNLETFHSEELIEYTDAALAVNFHSRWLAMGGEVPNPSQCIGYKKPLFLGGIDEPEHCELSDLDVYWIVFGQLQRKARGWPKWTG